MWMRAAVLLKIFRLENRIQSLEPDNFADQDPD